MPASKKQPQPVEYSTLSKWLHWGSSALVFGMLIAGTFMASLADGESLKLLMYRTHGVLGFLLVLATLARMVIRWRSPQPLPVGLETWNQWLHTGVHWGVYVVLLLLGFSGMTTFLANGVTFLNADPALLDRDIPSVFGHFLFTRLLILLVLLHLGGLFRYQFTKGSVLHRMGLRLKIGKA